MKNAPDYAKHDSPKTPNHPGENKHKKSLHGRSIVENMEIFESYYTPEEEGR